MISTRRSPETAVHPVRDPVKVAGISQEVEVLRSPEPTRDPKADLRSCDPFGLIL